MTASIGGSAFTAWLEKSTLGILPEKGGWLDQRLELLVKMDVIDFIVRTVRFVNKEDSDWNKITTLQRRVLKWMEHEGCLNASV